MSFFGAGCGSGLYLLVALETRLHVIRRPCVHGRTDGDALMRCCALFLALGGVGGLFYIVQHGQNHTLTVQSVCMFQRVCNVRANHLEPNEIV